jgi:GGDEF domain-containing protein
MEYEIIRCIRYPAPLSLIRLEMTPHVSEGKAPPSTVPLFETVLNARLRSADIPTRHGKGYLILLPTTDETGAQIVCERLLAVFDQEFETEEGITVRFWLQMGIASHSGGPTLMKEALLESAELGLERSRARGANTIGTFQRR